jgi:uncharacterized protein (DUF302 family)
MMVNAATVCALPESTRHHVMGRAPKGNDMTIKKVKTERFSVVSSKSFNRVMTALRSALEQPNMDKFIKSTEGAPTPAEPDHEIHRERPQKGLIIFMELDQAEILRREIGPNAPTIIRLLIGNPLITKEIVKLVPEAGSYTPVTVLVHQRPDGVHLSYDRLASLLSDCRIPEALAAARDLDSRIESLLRDCIG